MNTKTGTILVSTYISQTVDYGGILGHVPQENREFWDANVAFDGTKGMGVGLLSDRPVSGIKGVAYWATDKKILYRLTSDNTWKESFTPYAYPHPLRSRLLN
jgi:hypothetical protein